MSTKTFILDHVEILQKIQRLAWEVYENNYQEKELVVIGVKERGKVVADLLCSQLEEISELNIHKAYLQLDESQPLNSVFENLDIEILGKTVILVDDVLNTGKTLMLASVPILLQNPLGLQTVILANRDHKKFAISADYVGISLATTLHEHLSFEKNERDEYAVSLGE
jgi:pyrimidine operon attenuation protein / uracil phosphoribosyltransferase